MLNICPSLRAAPLTLQRVLTILSALASVKNGLLSKIAIFSVTTMLKMTNPVLKLQLIKGWGIAKILSRLDLKWSCYH